MIKKENRFDEYSYRVASLPLDPSVERIEEGQWVTIKGGKLVLAGADTKKAFIAIGSKREGRDQVSGKALQKVAFLVGNFMLTVSNIDLEKSYDPDMTPLKVVEGGILAPVEGDETVVAYAIGQPVAGYVRIVNA